MEPMLGYINVESRHSQAPIISNQSHQSRHLPPSISLETFGADGITAPVEVAAETVKDHVPISKIHGRDAVVLTVQAALSMMLNSLVTGYVVIAITALAPDLNLDSSLVYWPIISYNLVSSPLMLPFGSIADLLGAKSINLIGCLSCGLSILGAGFVSTGTQLIVTRCLQGLGAAMTLPTSMSIVSSSLSPGRFRNLSLACLGMGQVIGFGLGLVFSGIFLGTVGWRFGFWFCGGMQLALFILGLYAIPARSNESLGYKIVIKRLRNQVDWVGAAISCSCIGMVSYVLAMVAENAAAIKSPLILTLLAVSIVLMPGFGIWMAHQEKRNGPSLIPNSIWKSTFASLCIMVTLANAETQSMEFLSSLFFQNIQRLSPLETSIRLLPGLIVGAVLNWTTGSFVHRISVSYMTTAACLIASASPLMMALIGPSLPYWYGAFLAQALYPACIDTIFVVGALVVSDVFPEREQAMAGAVFTTIANLGQAIGLAVIAVVSNLVTEHQPEPSSSTGILRGYQAGFYTSFAWMILIAVIALLGLRRVGRIGIKQE